MRASIIEQILGGIAEQKDPLMPEKYPQYSDLIRDPGNQPLITFYPDGSRQFDDLVWMIGMITKEKSSLLTILASFLLHQNHTSSNTRMYFHDGDLTPPHTNNFIEFNYVLEGQWHKQIEGRDYVFNKDDIFLINRDISHGEYLYQKNAAVLCLQISNSFFDKSRMLNIGDGEAPEFVQHFVLDSNKKNAFIRFVPQCQINVCGGGVIIPVFPAFFRKLYPRCGGMNRGEPILSSDMWSGF